MGSGIQQSKELGLQRWARREEMEGQGLTSRTTKERIFVGGLGEAVTSEDLRKVFSSLGAIEAVDIIRTKGRSFAYVDFIPSRHNSLSKLFSTYNGCVWKGGRLKLEKAKEYYLARLRREWAEDTELVNGASATDADGDADKNMESSENPKKFSSEKKTLSIFFPKLRKVKSIPFSGTGKHKYSFRRIEVPSLPTYFCDCEEHSVPHVAKDKQIAILEEQGGGMNEEEFDMMKSVMNKFIERENISVTLWGEIQPAKGGDNSTKAIHHLQLDKNEDLNADEDNIMINMVSQGQETVLSNLESKFNDDQASEGGPTKIPLKKQISNGAFRNKKRKSVNDAYKSVSPIPGGKGSLPIADMQLDNEGGSDADDANLIINVVGEGQETVFANQESIVNEGRASKDGTTHPVHKEQRVNTAFLKKRKSVVCEEKDTTESPSDIPKCKGSTQAHSNAPGTLLIDQVTESKFIVKNSTPNPSWSHKSSWRDIVGDRSNSVFQISDILPGISPCKQEQSKENNVPNFIERNDPKVAERLVADQTKPDSASNKSGRGSAWLQKSSWMQLVGRNNSNSFSIAQILPGISFEKEPAKSDGVTHASSSDTENGNIDECQPTVDGAANLRLGKEDGVPGTVELSQQIDVGTSKAHVPVVENNCHSATEQTFTGDATIGQTCSFMRTDASLKEWAKTKAALSGLRKGKKNAK